MLAKKTVKNQITLPKTVVSRFGSVEYFDVSTDGKTIVLRPLRQSRLIEVQEKLEQLGIAEQDVSDAVSWARKNA
jgi:bifunctional DNA-binding transcriptional regulator/antitoxin component of YhaV-PrlF toxin-antitoxin module